MTSNEDKPYGFHEQLAKGQVQEDRLDRHFSKWYDIITATKAQQREGLDRMFIDGSGREVSVEYKADFRAHSTGNFYVETVSRGNYSEDGE